MASENFKTFSMTVTVDGGGEVRMKRRGSIIPMASEYQLTMKHTEFTPERSIESYGLLDLYSHHAFLTVLHTPRIYDAFAVFLRSEHSSENLTFWSRCARYIRLNREISQAVTTIDNDHLQEGAIEEVNVAHRFKMEGISKAKSVILAMEETLETYRDLQKEVEMLMWRDSYPRFLKHHLAYNASKSLEWSPTRMYTFKGLGECFCLTDPRYALGEAWLIIRKPDNPITLCSEAFVQVTGYPVSQIINHNCRFLQGSLSDPATVNRIRQAIKDGRESTEVFLNYRHDRTPFWNLLLVGMHLLLLY
jgi:PAS domain-containing protein